MPAYATEADMLLYVEGWVTDDEDALERLLERSSRAVDRVLRPAAVLTTGDYAGLKVDPADLEPHQRLALARATCAQAEYAVAMGPDFFVEPQYEEVRGPDFMTKSARGVAPPRIAPRVREELLGSGLTGRGVPWG